ncbi:ATP-binding protein [Parasporobacterium paucivorans]|uniref:Histidine kinase-, DNA gyrase B-, and HSP90-like ATPase n=1 Tax=Parasporobacterium paucivorans DSM 15970 TaxID=1122934 RepID=A0A1M6ISK2_9FIRM|nr:ATP-binding protein [Parasporobacterium paucivorans]SHJ37441.1 Histidine kinase-, DNA gyrase B-, and HSP90-like ATPase [Parasporobacterium paucivorans DSM 15970]
MAVFVLPVDQRVIDIDSRRFSSIGKAVVELITNCDDSYLRLERDGRLVSGSILIGYERHLKGALITVTDQAEGMAADQLHSILTYGGAHSSLAKDGSGGRGYFGRGLKQAVYGLGYGWIETIRDGAVSRVDLYRAQTGEYLFEDGDGALEASSKDYQRLCIPEGSNGTRISIIIDNPDVSIPYFNSLQTAIANNIYLRDILSRRDVKLLNLNEPIKSRTPLPLQFGEPASEVLIGPEERGTFSFQGQLYDFRLTLKRAKDAMLEVRGDERTNGLIVLSGNAILDCQFFRFENQIGTEFLFGTVVCDALSQRLGLGHPIISDEREGLNMKDPFVKAFSEEVSRLLFDIIKSEQLRLSHVERAKISQRTQLMIEIILQKMNVIARDELGIRIPPKHRASGTPGDKGPALRFVSSFYYRKADHPFKIMFVADRSRLGGQSRIHFDFQLPEGIRIEPDIDSVPLEAIPEDGHFSFQITGSQPGQKGRLIVSSGEYSVFCEIVIAEDAPSEKPAGIRSEAEPSRHASNELFKGYALRNLDNDTERAVYSPEERLIIINTEAPTVRLYVDGYGRFKDGARLLLAELLLDVITDELARRYIQQNKLDNRSAAFRKTKQDMVRRYGVEIHSILSGTSP